MEAYKVAEHYKTKGVLIKFTRTQWARGPNPSKEEGEYNALITVYTICLTT
jgi:hypothetical protein